MATPENRHYAVIDPYRRKLTLQYKGQTVAETENALILKEVGRSVYDPVFYIPKADISADLEMDPVSKGHCPIKGDSFRWYLKGEDLGTYFAWSYEEPLPRAKQIKDHLAFNMALVTLVSAPA